MRLPAGAHTSQPWRIHEIACDFRLEDVWALPTPGGRDDFPALVELMSGFDPARGSSAPVRALFAIRRAAGAGLGLDRAPREGPAPGAARERVPAELRGTASAPRPALGGYAPGLVVSPLYQTGQEWALEIANRTVDGILHVGWVPAGADGYRGQMAVLVKPNGLLGAAYMTAIAPFRHLVVYPAMLREIGERWRRRASAE